MKKWIYLVRHGETNTNASQKVHSSPSDPLSEKGEQQAHFIAERCASLPLEVLIASPFERAKQTATQIAKTTGLTPVESELFIESYFISKYGGKERTPESEKLVRDIYDNWGKPGYRVEDEETYDMLAARCEQALAFLAARPETHIGVVAHGMFLRNLLGKALFGDAFSPHISSTFSRTVRTANTGLSILNYHPDERDPWSLLAWNDHAHLAE